MRVVLQRTTGVDVVIDGHVHASTAGGLLVLFGTKAGDKRESCRFLAGKAVNLRIFEDNDGKMNLSALDVRGEIMVVSQFTLYADCRKGRRPSFTEAMEPSEAEALYLVFIDCLKESGLEVKSGVFGARMDVRLVNCGPVTIILDHDA
jgi:D-tyrosyl-tRNA(Tyr) deacylase